MGTLQIAASQAIASHTHYKLEQVCDKFRSEFVIMDVSTSLAYTIRANHDVSGKNSQASTMPLAPERASGTAAVSCLSDVAATMHRCQYHIILHPVF